MKKSSKSKNKPDERRSKKKAVRGIPLFYKEVKQKYNFTLTPEVNEKIRIEALEKNTSKSELLELLFRQRYNLDIPCNNVLDSYEEKT